MVDSHRLDDLAHRLAQAIPPGLKSLRSEMEQNFRSILQSGVERFDLVSREQFEVQRALLERTRSKLNSLEQRLKELEEQVAARGQSSGHTGKEGETKRTK